MSNHLSKKLRLAIGIISILGISSCATTEYVYVDPPQLPIPARPELPTVPAEQLQCLSDEAYSKLVERDAKRKAYSDQLEAIIGSTHE